MSHFPISEVVPGEKIKLTTEEVDAYNAYIIECTEDGCKPFYSDPYEYKTHCWFCDYYLTSTSAQEKAYEDYLKICEINGWEAKFDSIDDYIMYQEYIKNKTWKTESFADYKKKKNAYRLYLSSCNTHNWKVVFSTPEQYAAYIDYMTNRNEGEKWGDYIKRKNIKL